MENSLEIKQQLYQQCLDFIDMRFHTIQKTIQEIQESLTSETKSSAGDKHETGRAMLQLEREKAGQQLAEIQKVTVNLSKIDITKTSERVGLGSVVYTSKNNYFIAISAGTLQVGNDLFYGISAITPIGQLLIGRTVGYEITFKDTKFVIAKVL